MTKTTKTTLNLTQEAYIDGCEGAFLYERNADGSEMPTGIANNWYTASAIDAGENEYTVYWEILDDFDANEDTDDAYACDWRKPYMVLDEDGNNVTETVEIANVG